MIMGLVVWAVVVGLGLLALVVFALGKVVGVW